MIRLEHISYWYPKSPDPALCDLSLEIGSGESVCVMGRNGSGKSTLVKLIAGFIKPMRGQLIVNGTTESRAGPVGVIFQNPDNQMVATVVEKEIAFALENRAVAPAEIGEAVGQIAHQFGIEHLLTRLTSELSGGEKQRVALASVMIQNPSILLLDEPDSYLDQAGRLLLDSELERLHDQNGSLVELRITQSTGAAQTYDRLIVLDRGAVVADGSPSEIVADRDFCIRTGLIAPGLSNLTLTIPETLSEATISGSSGVTAVDLSEVSFGWPMAEPVLRDLSLSLQVGETVGLVGPTGCGKSSLVMLITGLIEATVGKVSYLNGSGGILESETIRGQVTLVLQQPERQFFLDNCADEIAFGPSNLGRKLQPGETDGYFEMVGLNPARYADRDPFSLSAGEKRRLAFAVVLSLAPSIIIFDEPTAGLDGEGVGRFMALSQRLRAAGLGQMIISHDGDVISRLVDRVLYLNERGDLTELTPETLVSAPEYAGLVSCPSASGQPL